MRRLCGSGRAHPGPGGNNLMAQAFDGSTIQTTVGQTTVGQTTVGQTTVRRPARARLQALAAYVKRNQSFLGRVLRQYAWNTVNLRLLKRTRVVEPLSAIFYVTHRCNLSCHYCTQKYPDILSQEVSTEKTIEILRIARQHLQSLYITGGEPLCRMDLEQVLEAAAGLGFNTILHTNGVLLDRREKVIHF